MQLLLIGRLHGFALAGGAFERRHAPRNGEKDGDGDEVPRF
jgi:hypothetical protein